MAIVEFGDDALVDVPRSTFKDRLIRERSDLQRLLRDRIELLDLDALVIAEEFDAWDSSRRRIDLLAVDREAKLVVIELKIEEDGGHMELQALRYAAMVSTMTFERAVDAYRHYLARRGSDLDPEEELLMFLNWDTPDEENFAQDVRIVLASPDFSTELTTAVLWLNERDLDITCIRLRPHALEGRTLLDIQQLIPLPEARSLQVRVREKARAERRRRGQNGPWTGVWFVNVGMSDGGPRDWNLCRRYGFVSAGGGEWYSESLKRLNVGDRIAAYQKGAGYLGVGVVTVERRPVNELRVDGDKTVAQVAPALAGLEDSSESDEYAVGVRWLETTKAEDGKTFLGVFANQNIVCKLRDIKTLEYLEREFPSLCQNDDGATD